MPIEDTNVVQHSISISELLERPELVLQPLDVPTVYSGPAAVEEATEELVASLTPEELQTIITNQLQEQAAEVGNVINEISGGMPSSSMAIDLPAPKQEFLGIRSVTLSDYLKALANSDAKSVILQEEYESQHFDQGNFGLLLMGDLTCQRSVLQEVMDDLSVELGNPPEMRVPRLPTSSSRNRLSEKMGKSYAAAANSHAISARAFLDDIKNRVADEAIRGGLETEEFLSATSVVGEQEIADLITVLRAFRGVLIAQTAFTKARWLTTRETLRNLRNRVINEERRRLSQECLRLESCLAGPALESLRQIQNRYTGNQGLLVRAISGYLYNTTQRIIEVVNSRLNNNQRISATASQSITVLREAYEINRHIAMIDDLISYLRGYDPDNRVTDAMIRGATEVLSVVGK